MEIESIKMNWKSKRKDKEATISLWNSVAEDYDQSDLPKKEENFALRIIDEIKMISTDSTVLDVGCGAGRYTMYFANKAMAATGTDISANMINYARKRAKKHNMKNIGFHIGDWHSMDLDELNWKNSFDLVFSHMTPAIQSLETFEKFIDASRGWCVMCKPTRRNDSISDKLREICEINNNSTNFDRELLFAFDYLWIKGYLPKIEYDKQVWNIEKPIEEAKKHYVNFIKASNIINEKHEKAIREYLESISINGIVKEKIQTTVSMLYWHV
ncbi:MAG: class I SAM-dependent methyltransferase [Eubacteriaceae bacterium]